jgi:hypothetical protein
MKNVLGLPLTQRGKWNATSKRRPHFVWLFPPLNGDSAWMTRRITRVAWRWLPGRGSPGLRLHFPGVYQIGDV